MAVTKTTVLCILPPFFHTICPTKLIKKLGSPPVAKIIEPKLPVY